MTQFSFLLALNLACLAAIFLFVRSRIRKALEAEGLQEKLREEMGQLVRDLNQTTDRNITLLEDAVRELKAAVVEADRRAVVLQREAERRITEDAVYDRFGRMRSDIRKAEAPGIPESADEASAGSSPPVRRHAPQLVKPAESEPSSVPEQSRPDSRPARIVPEVPAPGIPFVTFSSTPIRSKPPLKEEVLSLNRRGISSELIAAKLGITVAEVELIVSLEEQRGLASRDVE